VNSKAVSPLLGMIFLIMILTTFLALVQTYQVPQWSKSEELKHYDELVSEFSDLALLASGKSSTLTIDAGLDYADYPFLLTPPDTSSSIYTKEKNLSIKFKSLLPNGSITTRSIENKTSAIFLKPNYFYIQAETLVFENGVVFRKGEGYTFPVTSQPIFSGNRIAIPIIYTDIQPISTSSINLKLTPVEFGSLTVKEFNFQFETEFSDYWKDVFKEWNESLSEYSIEYGCENGTCWVNASGDFILNIDEWSVAERAMAEERNVEFLVIYPTNLTIPFNSSVKVDVWAFDKLSRPIQGIKINASYGEHLELASSSPVTNYDGAASFYFKGVDIGKGDIEFSYGSLNITVSYEVSVGLLKKVILNPIKDAFVNQAEDTTNYGDETYLKIGREGSAQKEFRTFIQFDLSIPSNATVCNAKLRMYMYGSTLDDFRAYTVHMVLEPWNELEITWDEMPDVSDDSTSYQTIPPKVVKEAWVEWDVTADVQAIVDGEENHGWMIKDPIKLEGPPWPAQTTEFYSREYSEASLRPQLLVYYS
jgi:hypothetical protein